MQARGFSPLPRRFRVGDWLIEQDTCVVSRGGRAMRVRPLLIDLLGALADQAGQVVTKDEILHRVWHDRFVSESVLTRTMTELRNVLNDAASAPHIIETIPRRGYRLIAPVQAIGRADEPRLAVLPFENLNHDAEHDYFADGICDALITELGSIRGLRVISRQSVLRYKSSARSLPDIARELKVSVVVEGAALQTGDRIRITAQLIQAEPEQHLWAHSYEVGITDILQLQGRVARTIAESVHAVLTPDDLTRLSRPRVAKPEAHLAYLKGRFHLRQWTNDSISKGFEYLRQAIAIDPHCAPAYVQLAEGLAVLGYWGHLPQQLAYTEAKAAVSKALELDEWLSDAHAISGMVSWLLDWDLSRCEREMLRAIDLNPSSPFAHLLYANFLVTMRNRGEEALREAALAVQFDPLSVNANFNFAYKLLFAGELDRALLQAITVLESFPDSLHAWYVRGWAELGLGKPAAAVVAFEKALALSPDAFSLAYVAHALGRSGRRAEARAILDDLMARRTSEHVPEFIFVLVYSGLGEIDAAFESMEKCFAERDSRLFWLQVVPCFEPLRSDPRYDDLARRLQLPPERRTKSAERR